MKALIIILFTVLFSMNMYTQSFIDNDSIVYSMEYKSVEYEGDSIINPSEYIVVIDLTKEQKEEILKLSNTDWQNLLEDKNTDFAANLLLYCFFKKDATLLEGVSRDEWLKCCKSSDISYWKKFLTNNKVLFE